MKIGFLGPAYPIRGGITQFIELTALEFQKEHEVRMFSFKNQYPKILFPGKAQLSENKQKPDLEIESILTPYNIFTWIPTIRKILKWKPDILILKYWIPFFAPAFGFIIRQLKKHSDIKIIYLIDNIDFHEKWLFADKFTKYALGKSDYLITLSNSVYKHAVTLFPKNNVISAFHPTYDCYNLQNFTPESARDKLDLLDKIVILFFGYIKPYKGVDLLLKAFPAFLKKYPSSHLLIVGEVYGSSEENYKLISEFELRDKVTFVEKFVSDDEVELYFKAADVLALPYKQATQSGVLQIANDMHLGAVATPVGGLPELVLHGKTGIVSESCSIEDFSKALIDFFAIAPGKIKENINLERDKNSWKEFSKLILESLKS